MTVLIRASKEGAGSAASGRGMGAKRAHRGQTTAAEPTGFPEGLVVGCKFKGMLKRDSGVLGLSAVKAASRPLRLALSPCPLGPSGALEG